MPTEVSTPKKKNGCLRILGKVTLAFIGAVAICFIVPEIWPKEGKTDAMVSAARDLETQIERLDDENWQEVIPSVRRAAAEVMSESRTLQETIDTGWGWVNGPIGFLVFFIGILVWPWSDDDKEAE